MTKNWQDMSKEEKTLARAKKRRISHQSAQRDRIMISNSGEDNVIAVGCNKYCYYPPPKSEYDYVVLLKAPDGKLYFCGNPKAERFQKDGSLKLCSVFWIDQTKDLIPKVREGTIRKHPERG